MRLPEGQRPTLVPESMGSRCFGIPQQNPPLSPAAERSECALGSGSDTHLAVSIGVEPRNELLELVVGDPEGSQSFVQLVTANLACNEN